MLFLTMHPEVEVNVMAELLTSIGLVVTDIMKNITTIATTIVNTPILLLTVGFLFIGGCVGIFGRLLSRS